MSEMDAEIGEIIHKQPTWESFKVRFLQHQIDQEEVKSGIAHIFLFIGADKNHRRATSSGGSGARLRSREKQETK